MKTGFEEVKTGFYQGNTPVTWKSNPQSRYNIFKNIGIFCNHIEPLFHFWTIHRDS